MRKLKCVWSERAFCLLMSLSAVLWLTTGSAGLAAPKESVQQYKMLSVLEYSGKSQFRNEAETLFTVRKQCLSNDKARYVLSANDIDVPEGNLSSSQLSSFRELSFVIDGRTRRLSGTDKDLAFLEKVTNQCVEALSQVTKSNVGKTWKQGFDLSSLGSSLPPEMRFTLTAIPLETEAFGELIRQYAKKPVFASYYGGTEKEIKHFHEGFLSLGVPAYPTPEHAVYAFSRMVEYARFRGHIRKK